MTIINYYSNGQTIIHVVNNNKCQVPIIQKMIGSYKLLSVYVHGFRQWYNDAKQKHPGAIV